MLSRALDLGVVRRRRRGRPKMARKRQAVNRLKRWDKKKENARLVEAVRGCE